MRLALVIGLLLLTSACTVRTEESGCVTQQQLGEVVKVLEMHTDSIKMLAENDERFIDILKGKSSKVVYH